MPEQKPAPAEGIIRIDTPFAKELGFTSDKFSSDSYLWKDGKRIMISLIFSLEEGKGHLSQLFNAIHAHGFRIAVPTPFARMQAILKKKGFKLHTEDGGVEIWEEP